jgi:hypothetical protein
MGVPKRNVLRYKYNITDTQWQVGLPLGCKWILNYNFTISDRALADRGGIPSSGHAMQGTLERWLTGQARADSKIARV